MFQKTAAKVFKLSHLFSRVCGSKRERTNLGLPCNTSWFTSEEKVDAGQCWSLQWHVDRGQLNSCALNWYLVILCFLDSKPNLLTISRALRWACQRSDNAYLLNPMPSNSGSLVSRGHSYSPARNHLQSLSERNSVNVGVDRTVIHSDYKLSRKSLLSVVYLYGSDTSLEYPETGDDGVGHLLRMKPEDWESPGADFAYSRGDPRGISREYVTVPLLVDSRNGEMVPCVTRHSTCRGVKVCPYHEAEEYEGHHYSATREQLMHRMRHSRAQQAKCTSPARDVFDKTSAYLIALKRLGCTAGAQEIPDEQSLHSPEDRLAFRRGYPDRPDRCTGQLLFGVTFSGVPYIKCEFHSTMSRDHFFDNTVGNGSLHIEYLEAVLTNDQEEVDRIEMEAQQDGYGPKTNCQTVLNNSAQRHSCSWNHRSEDGELKQPKLVSLTCHCVFREYEPLKEFREFCP
ncbi:hypothetical protein F5880DRAFT_1634594, partial [Lentinula raphanica]